MLKNADFTVYESKTYTRHVITGVYWNDSRGQKTTKNGIQVEDSVLVYIYDGDYLPKAKDLIVRGAVDFEFDTTSQKTISDDMARFREAYPQVAVIKSVTDCRYGGLTHIEVIAR